MRRSSLWIAALSLGFALACGGGGDVPTSSAPASVSTAPKSSGMTLNPVWAGLGASVGDGKIEFQSDTVVSARYTSGAPQAIADAFAKPFDDAGWSRTYTGSDPESGTVMANKGGSKLVVSTAKDGSEITLSAVLSGDPPPAGAAAGGAPGEGRPGHEVVDEKPPAPLKPVKPKRDCHDDVWYPCDKACEDAGWKCKTRGCDSVTGDCADACGDVQWECEKACNEKKWACEKE